MTQVQIGERQVMLSAEAIKQITRDELQKARQFAESITVDIENLLKLLDQEENGSYGSRQFRQALEGLMGRYAYVKRGVETAAELHHVAEREV